MFLHLSVAELIELIHQSVKEITVMGDYNQCAVKGLQRLFEPVLGPDVHVVRGFVQGQDVVGRKHQLRHAQSGPLAATEDGNFLVDVLSPEQEGAQQIPQLRADLPHRDAVQGAEHSLVLVQDILLILSVITDMNIMSDLRLAGDGIQFTHDHAHQGSLAFAVAADEGDLLAALDLDFRVTEDDLLRIPHGKVFPLEDDVA